MTRLEKTEKQLLLARRVSHLLKSVKDKVSKCKLTLNVCSALIHCNQCATALKIATIGGTQMEEELNRRSPEEKNELIFWFCKLLYIQAICIIIEKKKEKSQRTVSSPQNAQPLNSTSVKKAQQLLLKALDLTNEHFPEELDFISQLEKYMGMAESIKPSKESSKSSKNTNSLFDLENKFSFQPPNSNVQVGSPSQKSQFISQNNSVISGSSKPNNSSRVYETNSDKGAQLPSNNQVFKSSKYSRFREDNKNSPPAERKRGSRLLTPPILPVPDIPRSSEKENSHNGNRQGKDSKISKKRYQHLFMITTHRPTHSTDRETFLPAEMHSENTQSMVKNSIIIKEKSKGGPKKESLKNVDQDLFTYNPHKLVIKSAEERSKSISQNATSPKANLVPANNHHEDEKHLRFLMEKNQQLIKEKMALEKETSKATGEYASSKSIQEQFSLASESRKAREEESNFPSPLKDSPKKPPLAPSPNIIACATTVHGSSSPFSSQKQSMAELLDEESSLRRKSSTLFEGGTRVSRQSSWITKKLAYSVDSETDNTAPGRPKHDKTTLRNYKLIKESNESSTPKRYLQVTLGKDSCRTTS